MTYLIEQLINGICQGAIYALFAIGYTIIVGVVGLVSFTFGEVIMIGAFAALFTATLTGGNILLTILFSFAASGLIGIVIHKICYEKFFESARYIPLICTIAIAFTNYSSTNQLAQERATQVLLDRSYQAGKTFNFGLYPTVDEWKLALTDGESGKP